MNRCGFIIEGKLFFCNKKTGKRIPVLSPCLFGNWIRLFLHWLLERRDYLLLLQMLPLGLLLKICSHHLGSL
ncbi:cold shock protein CspD [Listeria monocytogenes]|nr:cold shock protein CspD [Listeria monocytogenes]GAT38700.1 cold shock protein CspD [Listeria monocytogenes]GAT40795.1 cold shock protein CspD [Listeria monocytogenes]